MARVLDRIRIALVFGGRSPEHSISCLSAGNIMAELDRERYAIAAIGIGRDGHWCRASDDPADWIGRDGGLPEVAGAAAVPSELLAGSDVVFPVLHGRFGEDGTIQGMLEILGLPYVGSGVLASAAAMDKPVAKRLMRDAGLPVGRFLEIRANAWKAAEEDVATDVGELGWPVFVKPARAGSSVGITKVIDPRGLRGAMALGFSHDDRVIVEAAVPNAREIELGVLAPEPGGGPRVSVPAEILVDPRHDFYDFDAKYIDGTSRVVVPAEIAPGTRERLSALAEAAFSALGCAGLARIDFLLASGGDPTLNEVNTMPGFTRSSAFPRMWEKSGIGYRRLLDDLIEDALRRG